MKEVKSPKKPLIYYYSIILLIVLLFNLIVSPLLMKNQVTEVDYGTFMRMIEEKNIGEVEVEDDEILFTDKDKQQVYTTGAMDDPTLTQRLYDSGATFTKEIQKTMSPVLSFVLTAVLPLVIFIAIGQYMGKKLVESAGGKNSLMFGGTGKSGAKVYVQSTQGIHFEDVAGEDEAKESIAEIVDYLHNPQKYTDVGASMPKGVLLVGPPGTGKTMLAKAVAGEANVPFFSMSGSEFVEMFVGMGASKVRDLFKQAKEKAPCIVFIDEIDAIGKKRDNQLSSNDEREQTLNQLLTEMDGFEGNNGVIILAATNRPESLDPALTRPGRFDRRVPVELPDLAGREAILKVHAKKIKTADDVDFHTIARMASGASGAELANIVNEAALRAVRAAIEPDVTLVIPDRIPPHKELTPGSPEPSERLLMTMLAFSSEPGVEISDMELHRSGKSYTVDTVRELRDCNPDAELYLVVGTDMLTTFEQWHDYRALLAQVTLVALARTSDEHAEVERFSAYLRQTYGARVIALPAEPIPVTSTDVRRLLPQRRGSEYLAPDVYAHIIQQRLYGAKPDLNWLREQAYPMLKPRRISHVWGCEHEARRLAERWGCDPDAAAEAGILHDCTKKFELSDQLLLSDKYGIINDTVETANTKLLHAKTGAAVARVRFGVPPEIENAIRWHTTGKPDMTTLEKVLYMADYIEPARDFDGVDELRRLAYTDLDAAMVLGLQMSLEDLRAGGITPHENTVQALNWYQGREKEYEKTTE